MESDFCASYDTVSSLAVFMSSGADIVVLTSLLGLLGSCRVILISRNLQ